MDKFYLFIILFIIDIVIRRAIRIQVDWSGGTERRILGRTCQSRGVVNYWPVHRGQRSRRNSKSDSRLTDTFYY